MKNSPRLATANAHAVTRLDFLNHQFNFSALSNQNGTSAPHPQQQPSKLASQSSTSSAEAARWPQSGGGQQGLPMMTTAAEARPLLHHQYSEESCQ